MSTQARSGIRAARSLLSLLEENDSEDFEAAESILGGDEKLANILQLLREYKEHGEPPLSIERLRDIIRKELVVLRLPVRAMVDIAQSVLGRILRTPTSGVTVENLVDQAFRIIEEKESPSAQVDALVALLIAAFRHAGAESEARLGTLLRDLAAQALTENIVMFSTLHTLAQLRTRWADKPLPYQPQESRRHLVERLLTDAGRLRPADFIEIAHDLLCQGMRGPADGAIAAVRRMKPKKAHGE